MKNLTEYLWEFWKSHCEYRFPYTHYSSCDGKCRCSYFPKYVLKNGKSHYGKLYLELEKVNKMCDCKKEAWWNRHTNTKTYKTCPMMDYLKLLHKLKGYKGYYKEFI